MNKDKKQKEIKISTGLFEEAVKNDGRDKYILRLYVAGSTVQSSRAVENIKFICEQHLNGKYDLEVIDLYQKPGLAKGEQIIAAPTLVKELPPPLRRIIGNLSNEREVLVGLDLIKKQDF